MRIPPSLAQLRLLPVVALLVGAVPAFAARAAEAPPAGPRGQPGSVVLFEAPGFPTIDAPALGSEALAEALRGLAVVRAAGSEELGRRLRENAGRLLLLPYGSAFPLGAWPEIVAFLDRGGSLVVLGGAPFHQPVLETGASDPRCAACRWTLGTRQPSFAHELLLGPAEEVRAPPAARVAAVPGSGWDGPLPPLPSTSWALTVRFASLRDLDREEGASGPRDAVLRPLAHVVDGRGTPRACPLLEIDRLRGPGAGGRWVLAPSNAASSPALVRAAVLRALEGPAELEVRPVLASLEPGERPSIRVALRRPAARDAVPAAVRANATASLVLHAPDGKSLGRSSLELTGTEDLRTGVAALPTAHALAPGLYRVEVQLEGARTHPRAATTAFWVRDTKLLASAPPLGVSRDWLRREGKVFPVAGTTYMPPDVHRKFLFEPDPALWDRDFGTMREHGINFVRTGLWTGWSRLMLDPGALDPAALRALDAYVLTAARHGIYVCFTFFAFLPPAWGGSNPYLDPRSLEAQRELYAAVASRYRGVGWVHYDLINEPSYSPADRLWQNLPIGDAHERRAWEQFVRRRHGADPARLRDRWREASRDPMSLPRPEELSYAAVRNTRHPFKALDFTLFTNEVVTRWAGWSRQVLRASGGDALVTLGQDEGGAVARPSQQLLAEAVDYTAMHTWWNNDDLLWDGLVSKVPEKPNLVQETGLMRLEDADGNPWRSPEQAAGLLRRKLVYALAARGAGAVQWAWHVNPYQPVDNESVIGFVRPDGTAKPELDAMADLARFLETAAPHLDDFEPDPVVLVLPQSRLFASRPGVLDGTRRLVKVLAERFGVVPAALSEYALSRARVQGARLFIVPSPQFLDDAASALLAEAGRGGAQVLLTGALEGNAYGERTPAVSALGVVSRGAPVVRREALALRHATFEGALPEQLLKGGDVAPHGAWPAWLTYEPLPLEQAREDAPLEALLQKALASAGVQTQPSESRVSARVLRSARAVLIAFVNEGASPERRQVAVDGRAWATVVEGGGARLFLLERSTGKLLAATPGPALAPADGTSGAIARDEGAP